MCLSSSEYKKGVEKINNFPLLTCCRFATPVKKSNLYSMLAPLKNVIDRVGT